MRTLIAGAAIALFCGCYSYKDMQVELKSAELIRIDTVYRYDKQEQVLTWKSLDNVFYTSYAAMGPQFILGSRVTVFVQR